MKTISAVAFATAVSATWTGWDNSDDVVTQVVQRIHYTCPCNGEESIVTTTVSSSWAPVSTGYLWPANQTTSASSVWSTTGSISDSSVVSQLTTITPSTTDTTASTTEDSSTVETPSTTAPSTTPTTTETTATTTTTSSSVPVISANEPFFVTPQISSLKLKKRASSYMGFTGDSSSPMAAVIVTDASSAVSFTITDDSALIAGPNSYSVGSSSTTEAAVLELWTSSTPATGDQWSVVDGVLTYPGASFCLSTDNTVMMYYDAVPTGCQLLGFAVEPDSSGSELSVTTSTTSATTSTSTASSTMTTSTTSTSTSTDSTYQSSTSSTSTSTSSSASTPTPVYQNTTCLNSVPSGSCYSTVSTNATSPQYTSKCDYTFSQQSSWATQYTFTQCMAACDKVSAETYPTLTTGCIGFFYNAATTKCGSASGAGNCYIVTKAQAPVVSVSANEDLLTDVWTLNLLAAYDT